MFAARLHRRGEPPTIDEVPDPAITAPTDVIVRVGATGLCRTDLHVIDGAFADLAKPLPTVLGHETAGWVEAVGPAVEWLRVGDAVVVHPYRLCGRCGPCRTGADQFCERSSFFGLGLDGGFAGYLWTDARSLVALGPDVDPRQAAGLADGGLAAYRAVKQAIGRLTPGTTAAIIGIGGLGHVAIQLVHELTAARVIAIDRSPDAIALADRVGADDTVLADGRHVATVRDLTGGHGVEVVFDFVGDGGSPAEALAMLARRGRYTAVGYGGRIEIPTADLVVNEFEVTGSLIGTYEELRELVALANQAKVRVTATPYPLAAFADAVADLRAGRVQGRAVLVP
jgi:NAD+-dependent secondary alcohol dehydrogenase Adh1